MGTYKRAFILLKYNLMNTYHLRFLKEKELRWVTIGLGLFFGLMFIFMGASLYISSLILYEEMMDYAPKLFILVDAIISLTMCFIMFGAFTGLINLFSKEDKEFIKAMPLTKREIYIYNGFKNMAFPIVTYILASFGVLFGQAIMGIAIPHGLTQWLIVSLSGLIVGVSYIFLMINAISFLALKYNDYKKAFLWILVIGIELLVVISVALETLGLSGLKDIILSIIFLPVSLGLFAYDNWFMSLIFSTGGLCIAGLLFMLFFFGCQKIYLGALEALEKPVVNNVTRAYSFIKRSIQDSLLLKEWKIGKAIYGLNIIISLVYSVALVVGCFVTSPLYFGVSLDIVEYMLVLISCVLIVLNVSTTAFYQNDIRQLWLIKTWPIKFDKYVESKIIICYLTILVNVIVICLGFYFSNYVSFSFFIILLIILLLLGYFDCLLGVMMGLKIHSVMVGFVMVPVGLCEGIVLVLIFAIAGHWYGLLINSILLIGGILALKHIIASPKTNRLFIKTQFD